MPTLKVDIDGVIVTEEKTFERSMAQPIEDAKKTIRLFKDLGWIVILETARGWQEYRMTIDQLVRYGIQYDQLLMGKPIADYTIDDRALRFESWQKVKLDILGGDDAYSLYKVREATSEFLFQHPMEGLTLEIAPMQRESMPFPEFYVAPNVYSNNWAYCGNDRPDFFDIQEQVDNIVAVNVLEHMKAIWKFPSKCASLLNERGKVYILVPYNLRLHGPKPDLWRFSDTGLDELMNGFQRLEMIFYGPQSKPYAIGAVYEKV